VPYTSLDQLDHATREYSWSKTSKAIVADDLGTHRQREEGRDRLWAALSQTLVRARLVILEHALSGAKTRSTALVRALRWPPGGIQ